MIIFTKWTFNQSGFDEGIFKHVIRKQQKKSQFSCIQDQGWLKDFLEGGADFQKFSKILSFFFLGRPNWFSELSQSTKKTLFW